MKIEQNKVVSINYTLKDNDGVVIDTSDGKDPLLYIHGIGNLIPGLENELEGKVVGDKVDTSINPEMGYGIRDENLLQKVPKDRFGEMDIKPGMQFQANSEQGPILVTIVKLEGDEVIVDGNHPLAGVILNFNVEIMEIREATTEELEHGHAHGPGGHNH